MRLQQHGRLGNAGQRSKGSARAFKRATLGVGQRDTLARAEQEQLAVGSHQLPAIRSWVRGLAGQSAARNCRPPSARLAGVADSAGLLPATTRYAPPGPPTAEGVRSPSSRGLHEPRVGPFSTRKWARIGLDEDFISPPIRTTDTCVHLMSESPRGIPCRRPRLIVLRAFRL